MFTLLAPSALAALGLLVIPIVIHLLKPKRVRTMPFSSLRWLRSSQHKLSRRIRWHQVLLFLLRAAFLAVLALALARPVFSRGGRRSLTERFVILDVSRSMRYEQPGAETPLMRGRKIARALLGQGLPGDRATILLTGHATEAIGPLTEDPTPYVTRLEAAEASLSGTNLSSALPVIRTMLANPRPNARAELIFITDHHQGAWSQGEIASFEEGLAIPTSVRVIDVGPSAPHNAWIAAARPIESGDKHFLRVRIGASGNEPQERTLRVKRLPGTGDLARKVTITPGAFAEVNLLIPARADVEGRIAELVLEPRDALPEDDVFWLNLDTRGGLRVLMLEPETTQVEALQPGYHLRAALEVLAHGQAGAIQITRRTPEAVIASDFANADVVIMANVAQLTDDRLFALEKRVKAGAGLLLFLGPAVETAFYDTKLYNPLRAGEGLLPRPLLQVAKGGLSSLTRVAWTHPLFAALADPAFGDLAQVRARAFYQFGDTAPGDTSQVLAWFGTAPALIEHTCGAGHVLIFNTTANDEWSDLPRRNCFLPLVDHVLQRLTQVRLSRSYEAGDTVALALPPLGQNASATIFTPGGRKEPANLQSIDGQTVARIDPGEAGVYALHATGDSGSTETSFVVQASRADSVVTKADQEIVRAWWGKVPFEIVHPDPAAPIADAAGQRHVLLWPWLLGIAALLLLAEMYFVHRLCPMMNPAVASSTVARQGILAPASKPEVTV